MNFRNVLELAHQNLNILKSTKVMCSFIWHELFQIVFLLKAATKPVFELQIANSFKNESSSINRYPADEVNRGS